MSILAELAQIRVGYTYRGSLKSAVNGNVAVIQMKDANPQALTCLQQLSCIQLPQLPTQHLLQADDLIFRARGQSNQAWCVPSSALPTICIAPLIVIRIHKQQQLLPGYLEWFINLAQTQKKLRHMARGSVVPVVGVQALGKLEIILPSTQRQQDIVEVHQLHLQSQELEAKLAQKRHAYAEHALLVYACSH